LADHWNPYHLPIPPDDLTRFGHITDVSFDASRDPWLEMKFVENSPLETARLAGLLTDRSDLYLVWPQAKWPFDHEQWKEALAPHDGHRSYYVYDGPNLIGHAALRKADTVGVYRVSFVYLLPQYRNQGLGKQMIRFLEQIAVAELDAVALKLVVRDYNPQALNCYRQSTLP
jgi:ribosomal protein S18 acetylase RimI-like enzyme